MSRHKTSRRVRNVFIAVLGFLPLLGLDCPTSFFGGSSSQTQNYFQSFSKVSEGTNPYRTHSTVYDSVAPDSPFTVDVTVRALGDSSVVCVGVAGCEDTVAVSLVMTCREGTQTFDVPLHQEGGKATGRFTHTANGPGECVSSNGQRNPVDWEVILQRIENEAVEFDVTVEWTDFNAFLR